MRFSRLFVQTLREAPAEAEIVSHSLMMRAGYIQKLAAGVYNYLPLAWRVISKISNIIREEMNAAGAQELLMPALQPAELWQESGRWQVYGPELMRVEDRHERSFCLGPTHEEVITDLVRRTVKSYRQLPLNLYQIQTKFRDEIRPRFGLMRAREFMMKDAYSFDVDEVGLDVTFAKMHKTYCRIFERCGLDYRVVEADPGAIGGSSSKEFMVLAPTGEEGIATCKSCNAAANIELAKIHLDEAKVKKNEAICQGKCESGPAMEKVSTPNVKTIEEVTAFLKQPPEKFIKTLIYKADGKLVAALVRGDHHISPIKLRNALVASEVDMATAEEVRTVTGCAVGFAGPAGLPKEIKIVADQAVVDLGLAVTGANTDDTHVKNVIVGRDYKIDQVADIRQAVEGDVCGCCGKEKLVVTRGIEVGHVFKLGTKYSKILNASFTDEKGAEKLMIMGCYGIGVGRTAAAAIEQNNDKFGIKWPLAIAPYQIIVLPLNWPEENTKKLAEDIYAKLEAKGYEVILDDREATAGVKFNDADLIGIPLKIILGPKNLAQGKVELGWRMSGEKILVEIDQVIAEAEKFIQSAK